MCTLVMVIRSESGSVVSIVILSKLVILIRSESGSGDYIVILCKLRNR